MSSSQKQQCKLMRVFLGLGGGGVLELCKKGSTLGGVPLTVRRSDLEVEVEAEAAEAEAADDGVRMFLGMEVVLAE